MENKRSIKKVILSLLMVFLLLAMIACSSNDNENDQVKDNPVVDKDEDTEIEEVIAEEETIETQL